MPEFETEVSDIIQRTEDVKSFRFRVGEGPGFKAGQYFFVTIKIEGKERTKHFSFSNSPTEKGYIEFTKRITDSEFSKALDNIKIGEWAKIRMPYGSFILPEEYDKIAFLSGGIGITPIRSMCKYAADKKLPLDIILLYGNNKEKDIIFKKDFDGMAQNYKNIRIIYTLTSPGIDKKNWNGRTGFIDDEMIREEVPDYDERIFYICGPPKMVDALSGVLENKIKLGKDRIRIENFNGYL